MEARDRDLRRRAWMPTVVVAALLLALPGAARAQQDHDPFDNATVNDIGAGGGEVLVSQASTFSRGVTYNSEIYGTSQADRTQDNGQDYVGCRVGPDEKALGSNTGWTRFVSAVAGTLSVNANTTYDVLLNIWNSKQGYAPRGGTPQTFAALNFTTCSDVNQFKNGEAIGEINVQPNVVYWAETLGVCGRFALSMPWQTACSSSGGGGDDPKRGGSNTVTFTFVPNNQDGDGVADTLDECPNEAAATSDGCPAASPSPEPTPAPTSQPTPAPTAAVATPTPTPPPDLDEDDDGVPRPIDCDDADPRRAQNLRERRGNAIDEDCDGDADPYLRLDTDVRNRWGVFKDGSGTRVERLNVEGVPRGAKVTVRCAAPRRRPGCAFGTKTGVRRGSVVRLAGLFRSRKLPVGTRVTITVTAPERLGERLVYTTLKRDVPRLARSCVNPRGAAAPCA